MTKAKMPCPDWQQYKVVPTSVLERYVENFYININWNSFCFDTSDHTSTVIAQARPGWTEKQIKDFDMDCCLRGLFP
jgi:hypothetical protein